MLGQDAIFVLKDVTPSMLTFSESGTNLTNYGQMRLRGIDQTRINITLERHPTQRHDRPGRVLFQLHRFWQQRSLRAGATRRRDKHQRNRFLCRLYQLRIGQSARQRSPAPRCRLLGGSFSTYRASGEVKTGLLSNSTALLQPLHPHPLRRLSLPHRYRFLLIFLLRRLFRRQRRSKR